MRRVGIVEFVRIVSKEILSAATANFTILNDPDPFRETILVVSHEASRTGAPILALNLVKKFSEKYNVVVILLGTGSMLDCFMHSDASAIQILNKNVIPLIFIRRKVQSLVKNFHIKYALVNSIESRHVLDVLNDNKIPTISLIHEFASYTRPKDAFRSAFFYSTEVVFSADIVRQNIVSELPDLASCQTHLLPQGLCNPPVDDRTAIEIEQESDRIRNVIHQNCSSEKKFIVLGAGSVQIRKGVDLFIECACRIKDSPRGEKFKFVWIGKGYDPENDLTYSAYLKDQISRAGLQGYVEIINETFAIEAAYKEADLFLLSSRLDPLPNVAIEVMAQKVPVLCFNKTTGIADFLIENDLGDACVAEYLNGSDMAEKIAALSSSKTLYDAVARKCHEASARAFDMEKYISNLERVASNAVARKQQELLDIETIKKSGLMKSEFFQSPYEKNQSIEHLAAIFVRSWASGVWRRKPFSGFHPGIYSDIHGVQTPWCNPLADYIRQGCPTGPWKYQVISNHTAIDCHRLPKNTQVALHIHAYYCDELAGIIEALLHNQIQPDLFISVPNQKLQNEVAKLLSDYSGSVKEIQVVPNRGRDIGPLLTQFGKVMLERYSYIGHLHTKKTVTIGNEAIVKLWRDFLIQNLLGSKKYPMADRILAVLESNSHLGIVFPDDPNVIGWTKNKPFANSLFQRLKISELPDEFLFPVGTMFWARADALRDIIELGLDWDDYPLEPVPYDGSMLHALERLFGFPANELEVATVRVDGTTR